MMDLKRAKKLTRVIFYYEDGTTRTLEYSRVERMAKNRSLVGYVLTEFAVAGLEVLAEPSSPRVEDKRRIVGA
jgi:hypothetical protein